MRINGLKTHNSQEPHQVFAELELHEWLCQLPLNPPFKGCITGGKSAACVTHWGRSPRDWNASEKAAPANLVASVIDEHHVEAD